MVRGGPGRAVRRDREGPPLPGRRRRRVRGGRRRARPGDRSRRGVDVPAGQCRASALGARRAGAVAVRTASGDRSSGSKQETHRGQWGVLGAKNGPASRLCGAGDESAVFHASMDEVLSGEAPRHIVLCLDDFVAADPDLLATVGDADKRVLDWVQRFLAEEPLAGSTLVVLTRLALDTGAGESVESLPGASVWGLIRSAQTEHPGRFRLVDIDDEETSWARFPDALALGEDQLALRGGAYLVPRMTAASPADHRIEPPAAGAHRLGIPSKGTLENLTWVPCPEVEAPLTSGQVRIAVQAAGLNFRDVTIALGLVDQNSHRRRARQRGRRSRAGGGGRRHQVWRRVTG